jgi:hypothetical protein
MVKIAVVDWFGPVLIKATILFVCFSFSKRTIEKIGNKKIAERRASVYCEAYTSVAS